MAVRVFLVGFANPRPGVQLENVEGSEIVVQRGKFSLPYISVWYRAEKELGRGYYAVVGNIYHGRKHPFLRVLEASYLGEHVEDYINYAEISGMVKDIRYFEDSKKTTVVVLDNDGGLWRLIFRFPTAVCHGDRIRVYGKFFCQNGSYGLEVKECEYVGKVIPIME